MPRSLFCGACFSYIIPPPRNSLSSGFWHLFPPDAEKAGATRKKSRVRSNPAERAAAHHSVQRPFLFTVIFIHSQHVLFSSSVCSCSPLAARISPANKKPTLTPQNKTHDACCQYHCAASFLLPYFTMYHLSDAIAACRKRQDHCPTCKLFCAGALQDSAASAILLTTLI